MLAVSQQDERVDLARTVLVAGLGQTGVSVVKHLLEGGVTVRVADSRADPPGLAALGRSAERVELFTGDLTPDLIEGVDEVVLSPGLAADIPLARAARRRGIPVVGDIELFARWAHCPVIGITGSNGKSTVTALTATLLRAAGKRAQEGGNFGPPALDLLAERDLQYAVLELSSFQLETTYSLRPDAGALLNVSPDHIDRHGSAARYAELKGRIIEWSEIVIVNRDDPAVAGLAKDHGHVVTFGLDAARGRDFGIVKRGADRWLAQGREPLLPVPSLSLPGSHNQANALAALALIASLGIEPKSVCDALSSFEGLPHRCQRVRELAGVRYVNDSKATNPAATAAALVGLGESLILIAGGQSKGADLAPLAAAAAGRVKQALLFGEDRDRLAAALDRVCPLEAVGDLDEAVAAAGRLAESGDTVLLSPACASYDMFDSYIARGKRFVELVEALK